MKIRATNPFFYLSLIIIVLITFAMCGSVERTVASVYDGDTFTMSDGERIRMAEMDAPEQSQTYGEEAREFLISKLRYGKVSLRPVAKDRYDRTVCNVYVDGVWINELMVREGYAWAYEKYSSLYPLQIEAKANKKGLWAHPPYIPPFIYRKQTKLY